MTLEQGITFGITVGLGLCSLSLTIFTIRLSVRFARDARESLGRLQEKAAEIRVMTDRILSQQDKHIGRILERALHNRDGETSEAYARNQGHPLIEKALESFNQESNHGNE